VKTPAPERAASRKKLAAKGQALGDGTAPVPDLAYLRKAIRAKGRVDPAKWPALKRLIVKRARQLKATSAPGVKGTWPFHGANNDSEAISLATMTRRMPVVRGPADVQLSRTAPGMITAQHKSSGMKIGVITPEGKGYAGKHADGTPTGASGSQQGALAGLITHHNKRARGFPAAQQDGTASYAGDQDGAVDLAGALPFTSANSSMDGPRVTTMGTGKPAASAKPSGGLSPDVAAIYRKLLAKGMKPAQAMAMAKRAAAMHAKASAA
jgi:hypothetical protein